MEKIITRGIQEVLEAEEELLSRYIQTWEIKERRRWLLIASGSSVGPNSFEMWKWEYEEFLGEETMKKVMENIEIQKEKERKKEEERERRRIERKIKTTRGILIGIGILCSFLICLAVWMICNDSINKEKAENSLAYHFEKYRRDNAKD